MGKAMAADGLDLSAAAFWDGCSSFLMESFCTEIPMRSFVLALITIAMKSKRNRKVLSLIHI